MISNEKYCEIEEQNEMKRVFLFLFFLVFRRAKIILRGE